MWKSLESVSSLEETCSEKGEIVSNFLIKECGWKHTSLDKSAFFRAEKFEYKCGACFRDKNPTSLDQNISEANGDFGTNEYREVMGIIAIREEAILISGGEMFIEYITQRISGEFAAVDSKTMTPCLRGWG